MMDIVSTTLRHRDLQAELRTAPSESRKETQSLDEDECTRRLPNRHQGCMGEPHLVQSKQLDLPIARAHSQTIGNWPSLAHEVRIRQEGCVDIMHHWMQHRGVKMQRGRCR